MEVVILEKKAALYIRVSTLYQIDKDSLPLQREELINYAKYVFNITDCEVFEDAGYSGKNTDRPAYQDMMTRIRAGEFSHLMVWKIDRISRNLLDFAAMYDELKDLEIIFISKNEQFDTSTAMGEAMLKIILVFAELERNMTSERVSAIMISRAEKGLWNGANVPFGYKWSKEKNFPIICEEESPYIKLIFDMYEDRPSSSKIAQYLNAKSICTKRGGTWGAQTILQMLKNPFFKGTLRYNYRRSGKGKIKAQEDWIIKDNNHPGIISSEQWDRVQKLIEKNTKQIHRPGQSQQHKHIHIFAGVIRCRCGASGGATQDRPRKDGWRPSRYLCTHITYGTLKCDNSLMIGDLYIGSFVFNYIRNILYVQHHITDYPTPESIEQRLLHSSYCFENVFGIEKHTLQELYDSFTLASNTAAHPFLPAKKIQLDSAAVKIDDLISKRQKHQYAFERLKRLYLYDENAFSEKDFISEKQQIMQKIDKINEELQKLSAEADSSNDIEMDFLEKASNFILMQKLLGDDEIVWQEFARHTDPEIIQRFVKAIITKIVYYDKKIYSIEFKNGSRHVFLYK